MKKLLLALLVLLVAGSISAQNITCKLSEHPTPGTQIEVALQVTAIDADVLTFQVYVQYDPTVLSFVQANYMNPQFPTIEWVAGNAPGEWGGNWFGVDFLPETIAPGDSLCTVTFDYLGGDCSLDWGLAKGNAPIKGQTLFFDPAFNTFNQTLLSGCVAGACGVVTTPGLWTGDVDTDWYKTGNWDDGALPTSAVDVLIPASAANQPVIANSDVNGVAESMALEIEPGATLGIEATGELTASGVVTNDGSMTITGGSFINMDALTGVGNFQYVRDLLCAGILPGTNDPYGWHLLSAPIDGLTTDDLPDYFINVWNQAAGTWTQYSSGVPCTPWPMTPLADMDVWSVNIDNMYPYPECPGSPTGNGQVITFSGDAAAVHDGPYNFALGNGPGYQVWNTVANPYPSGLNLNAVTWGANTVQGAAFFDGCNAGNDWVEWTPVMGAYSVPAAQGFFVETLGGTGSVSFDDTERDHGQVGYLKDEITSLLTLRAEGANLNDELNVRFMDNMTPGFDLNGDFHKMVSSTLEIYTIAGSDKLAINALPATEIVPMGFESPNSGSYTISAVETSEFSQVYLLDKVTGDVTDMLTNSYTFEYTVGDDANRFEIHFAPVGIGENLINSVSIWSSENNIYVSVPKELKGTIAVYNMMGQEVVSTDTQPGTNVIPMDNVNTYYVVKVLSQENVITGKVYIK